jgi:hypothetical protein
MKGKIGQKSGGRKPCFYIFHPSFPVRSALLFTIAFPIMAVFTGFFMTGCAPDPFFIPVLHINGVPDTGTAGIPLALTGTVNPGFATNSAITWLVLDARSTGAELNGHTLSTHAEGSVLIKGIVANGAAV